MLIFKMCPVATKRSPWLLIVEGRLEGVQEFMKL